MNLEEREQHKASVEVERLEEKSLSKSLPEIKLDKNKVIKEIKDFNLYCEPITWSSLFSFMDKGRFNVVNAGMYGVGKSRGTKELLSLLDLKNVTVLAGHITPAKMFDILSIGGCIILDESYSLFINPHIKHILRSALYDGHVVWYSRREDSDTEFKGSIIFNTNDLSKKTLNDKALLDRCFLNIVDLSNEQILKKQHIYEPSITLWKAIGQRIIQLRSKDLEEINSSYGLSNEEIEAIRRAFDSEVKSIGRLQKISMRSYKRFEEIFRRMKWLFGYLDKELFMLAHELGVNYIAI